MPREPHPSQTLVRAATSLALAYNVVTSSLAVLRVALLYGSVLKTVLALLAVACVLPLHLRTVYSATHGERYRFAGWSLVLTTVVAIGLFPVLGWAWQGMFYVIAVAVLIVLPAPWSFVAYACVVVAQWPLAKTFGAPDLAPYYILGTLISASPIVFVWLARWGRELRATSRSLADQAVLAERLRIDGQLQRAVREPLQAIAAQGDRAADLAAHDPAATADELRRLTATARQTLAGARSMIAGYQETSLRAEVDNAIGLLAAANIDVRVDGSLDEIPAGAETDLRRTLRDGLTQVLAGDGAAGDASAAEERRVCTISIDRSGDAIRLSLTVGEALVARTERAIA